jgi:SMC interacting uncharacterized protein involved in chromosome segregation
MAAIAAIAIIVLTIYLAVFISKATNLIQEVQVNFKEQSKQLKLLVEKTDELIIDVHQFVNNASESLEKVNVMSDQITGFVNKVNSKTGNLMSAVDEIAVNARETYFAIEKPIRAVSSFISNFSDNIAFVKSIFPSKRKA